MANFELVEIAFEPDDFQSTLEDEFLLAKLTREIEGVTDIEQLRQGALKLLQLAVMRQGMIRGLCKRLAGLESGIIRKKYED
jgi:hypothetical protein